MEREGGESWREGEGKGEGEREERREERKRERVKGEGGDGEGEEERQYAPYWSCTYVPTYIIVRQRDRGIYGI